MYLYVLYRNSVLFICCWLLLLFFGGTNPIGINEYYNDNASLYTKGVSGIPSTGSSISLQQFYGKAKPSIVGNWSILMYSNDSKGTTNHSGSDTIWGNTGSATWRSITSSSTGASSRNGFGDGVGLYSGFFLKKNITKIALVDGTGNLENPTSNQNFLIYNLGETTGNETIYDILKRLDAFNLSNSSWSGNDTLYLRPSVTSFTAGANGYSGTLVQSSGNMRASSSLANASTQLSSVTPDKFCIWGVNVDSDNDVQIMCTYSGNLLTGKSDSWRNNSPPETHWSYWGNDWHTNTQTQTISAGKQTDPGLATNAGGTKNIYVIAFSGESLDNSTIIAARHTSAMNTLLGTSRTTNATLIFRASRDGWSGSAFHTACDNIAPIFMVFKSTGGYIATAYTPIAFRSVNNYVSATSGTAWLNNLENSSGTISTTKFLNTSPQYTLYDNASYGPTFGGGHDIYIQGGNMANVSTNQHSYSGTGYSSTVLFGARNATLSEIEVYSFPAFPITNLTTISIANIANLVLWHNGYNIDGSNNSTLNSGSEISSWYNSGNDSSLTTTQSTSSYRPTYTQNGVEFTAGKSLLSNINLNSSTYTAMNIFIVWKKTQSSSTLKWLWSQDDGGYDRTLIINSDSSLMVGTGNGGANFPNYSFPTYFVEIVNCEYNSPGQTGYFYVNNTSVTTFENIAVNGTTTTQFGSNGGGSSSIDGIIHEILIISRILSSTERTNIYNTLLKKYVTS